MKNTILLTIAAAVGVACSSEPKHDARFIQGFDPPAPASNELQVITPIVKGIAPGADVTYCSYIANPFGKDVDVVASDAFMSLHGHHVLLMEVTDDNPFKPGDQHVCTDADMNKARYVSGGGSDLMSSHFKAPAGIGMRIHATSKMLVQSHWINPSATGTDGQSSFNIVTEEPSASRQEAQLFTVTSTQFDIKAHATGHIASDCKLKQDMQLALIAGHEHEWGSHISIEHIVGDGMPQMMYQADWKPEYQSAPPQQWYPASAPIVLKKDDIVRVTCDWNNTTDTEIVFPREMCVAAFYYFPATADVDCVDGIWQTN
jgi:hypothetical protein